MEVILLEKTRNLGELGDKVNVKSGFGRNFLIPQGKAVPATPENLEVFEKRRAELEAAAAENLKESEVRKAKLEAITIVIPAKAGDEGKLFGSVGPRDIADAYVKAGEFLEKKEVSMPEGAIRQAGEYELTLQLHTDVQCNVTVAIVPEEE